METLKYQTEINASAEKVWDVLWNENTYSQWTHYFSPGSVMESDWQVGGKTLFLDASRKNGMISTIQKIEKPTVVIFKHSGEIINGIEDTESEKVKVWSGGLEAYFLEENNGKTVLKIEVDYDDSFKEMMEEGFKKGLEIIKELSEK